MYFDDPTNDFLFKLYKYFINKNMTIEQAPFMHYLINPIHNLTKIERIDDLKIENFKCYVKHFIEIIAKSDKKDSKNNKIILLVQIIIHLQKLKIHHQ